MNPADATVLRALFTDQRVLALSVLREGKPYIGLLPFAVEPDNGSALVHASDLARHTSGLTNGAPFAALIHASEQPAAGGPPVDVLQLPRVSLQGTVARLDKGSEAYASARQTYLARFPDSEPTFSLGDFNLYRLGFDSGRLVAGFARAVNLSPVSLRELTRS